MRNIVFLLAITSIPLSQGLSRSAVPEDSLAKAKMAEDSVKMAKLFAIAEYPFIKGSKWSGVIPVTNATEIPDPNHDYKLLFEVVAKNPDSLAGEINISLDEVARILNLHVASGIPPTRIIPVIVVHGPGIEAITTNERYRNMHSVDNPNLQLIKDFEDAGTKFIVCGQAMAFFETTREDLLPEVKISLTAQTVLSNYQARGFVLYTISPER